MGVEKQKIKAEVIIYTPEMNEIGGIEEMTYAFCHRMAKKHDVLFVTETRADRTQINRIKKVCRVEFNNPETKSFECDYLIYNQIYTNYKHNFKVNKKCKGMVHADYKYLKDNNILTYKPKEIIDDYLAVSQLAADKFHEAYNIKCKVLHNMLDFVRETKPQVRLITASRLSSEKGYENMIILSNEFNKRGFYPLWEVFTNTELYSVDIIDNFIFRKTKLDIYDNISSATYGVQLSKTEGDCVFIKQCWQYSIPTITTDFPSIFENEKNGHIIPLKLFERGTKEEWDKVVYDIINNIPKVNFKEKTTEETWENELKGIKTIDPFVYEPKLIEVEVIYPYTDIFSFEIPTELIVGYKFETEVERALYLQNELQTVKILEKKGDENDNKRKKQGDKVTKPKTTKRT